MGREVIFKCDWCGKPIEKAAAKLYLAPILPGKSIQSYQSQYTHSADLCGSCASGVEPKMTRRKRRSSSNKVTPIASKKKNRRVA